MKTLALLLTAGLTAGLAAGCASSPTAPPDELAQSIVVSLDAGDAGRAKSLYSTIEDDQTYREKLYPVVFGAARERFESGDAETAVTHLTFLSEAYPKATSVRVALAYALFLVRAGHEEADPELTKALREAVVGVRDSTPQPPAWIDLIDAQRAIDDGKLEEARIAYDRFLASWNGDPGSLVVYVEDVGRYLASH